jgi:hypothetical protein
MTASRPPRTSRSHSRARTKDRVSRGDSVTARRAVRFGPTGVMHERIARCPRISQHRVGQAAVETYLASPGAECTSHGSADGVRRMP